MKNEDFNTYLSMYMAIYDLDYTSYSLEESYGIKIGVLQYSAISGEAQKALIAGNKNIEEDILEVFKKPNKEVAYWFSNKPVALAGTFLERYTGLFSTYIQNTTAYQKSAIQKIRKEWEDFLEALGISFDKKEEAAILARFIQRDLSKKDQCLLCELLHKNSNGKADVLEKINNTPYINAFLGGKNAYLPGGRMVNLAAKFPSIYASIDD